MGQMIRRIRYRNSLDLDKKMTKREIYKLNKWINENELKLKNSNILNGSNTMDECESKTNRRFN